MTHDITPGPYFTTVDHVSEKCFGRVTVMNTNLMDTEVLDCNTGFTLLSEHHVLEDKPDFNRILTNYFNTFGIGLEEIELEDSTKLVALEGTWLYAGKVPCKVRILRSNTLFGSGDHDDPPEISEDKDIECYYIEYESLTDRGSFTTGGGAELTLLAAMDRAEQQVKQIIKWNN